MEKPSHKKRRARLGDAETKKLFESCERIKELASKLDDVTPESMSHIQAQVLIDREIGLIHQHLYRLARANLLEVMGLLIGGASWTAENIDNKALDMIVPLIDTRKSTGRREIVHAIGLLFAKNPGAGPNDALKYLNGTVRRTISGARRKALRENSPHFLSTCRKVEYYIGNSERYERRDGTVYDRYTEYETEGLRFAGPEDLIALCGSIDPLPSSVAESVETIFECLSNGNGTFRTALRLRDLQAATYQMLEPILIDQSQSRGPLTPEEEYLLRDHERKLRETAEEMEREYQWRRMFDKETQTAFCEACFEYFWDKECRGKPSSRFKYLAACLPGCTKKTYEDTYKPSFQHFIKMFDERWQKKLHAKN
jgi:hypothetical protein